MRTKATAWLDTDRHKAVYGVAVMRNGKWCHMAKRNDKGHLEIEKYETEAERDTRRAELRKAKWD